MVNHVRRFDSSPKQAQARRRESDRNLCQPRVALGLAEILVRVAFRGSMDFDMEMWKYATQIKVPSDDPRVVHEHRGNGKAFLMGVEVTTNSLGLREGERLRAKPPGTYRIVALGDSITMGWGVSQDMTFPAQLERQLNARPPRGFPEGLRYEVLNLGVGNYNTVQEVMRLKNIGLDLAPDLIILGYFINDAEPTPKPDRGFLIEHSYLYAFAASRTRMFKPTTGTYLDYYRGLYATTRQVGRQRKLRLANSRPSAVSGRSPRSCSSFLKCTIWAKLPVCRVDGGSSRSGQRPVCPWWICFRLLGDASRSLRFGCLRSTHTTMRRRKGFWPTTSIALSNPARLRSRSATPLQSQAGSATP